MWVNQKDEIKHGVYGPNSEDFGKSWGRTPETGPKTIDDWIGCREVFHNENRHLKRFYYCHALPEGRGRSISVFFDKIEDRLKLKDEDRTRFGPTNKRKVMWVEASEWWRCHSMRRSLFTALLRHATNYRIYKNNFEESLYTGDYLENTRSALDRFLDGNTCYWGGYCGWVAAFDTQDWHADTLRKHDITKLLRDYPKPLPPKRKKKITNQTASQIITAEIDREIIDDLRKHAGDLKLQVA